MANKIKYGLKNAYYAKITDTSGAITYGTPVRIPGAVSLSLSPVGETTPFYADDMEYFTAIANNGYDGSLELALVPQDFATAILGETVSTTDKVAVENSLAQPAAFALLFEFQGDVKAIRHVLYNCKATRPNIESGTKTTNIEAKTETLNLTARPLADGKVKAKSTDETTSGAYDSWYTKVWTGDAV